MAEYTLKIGEGGTGPEPLASIVQTTQFEAADFAQALETAKEITGSSKSITHASRACLVEDDIVVWSWIVEG
jgi:hypothetical protein